METDATEEAVPADAGADTPATVTERWVFGGSRVAKGNKRAHCWVDPDGKELWFPPSHHYTVGGVYDAQVERKPGGDGVTKHGWPEFTGQRCEDRDLVDQLSARHRAAETALARVATERRLAREDPLDAAVERLAELVAKVPPSQRVGLVAHIMTKLLH